MNSIHHSFDINLASEYSIEEDIIIHHFQHWIRINKKLNRNFRDGKTWTYQSRKEIAAHFPYFTDKQIRSICESLLEKKVLISGNFNKNGFDRTLWYAFADEEKFIGNSNNFYVSPNGQMEKPKRAHQYHILKTNTKEKAASCSKEKNAAAAKKEKNIFKLDHPVYKGDRDMFKSVMNWYKKRYGKSPPRNPIAIIHSCIKNEWYLENEDESNNQNNSDRVLNYQFSIKIEKAYDLSRVNKTTSLMALKSGISFYAGQGVHKTPSYSLPHELFKEEIKQFFQKRNIWDKIEENLKKIDDKEKKEE